MRYDIVVLGSSWGGLSALRVILGSLPGDFRLPIVIVQHRSPNSRDRDLTSYYDARCELPVCMVDDKQPIEDGRVYLAPPDYHLFVGDQGFELSTDAAVSFSRPSVDVLFQSAADRFGDGVIGVVLTGANLDGADGLATIARAGGFTIVQDPETADRRDMPDAAIAAVGKPDAVLTLDEIAPFLTKLAGMER